MSKSEARDRALDLLEKVGLTHVKDRRPHYSLVVEQQRVCDCEL